jgi:hypothetical protein
LRLYHYQGWNTRQSGPDRHHMYLPVYPARKRLKKKTKKLRKGKRHKIFFSFLFTPFFVNHIKNLKTSPIDLSEKQNSSCGLLKYRAVIEHGSVLSLFFNA